MARRTHKDAKRSRAGAVFSLELVLVLPILLMVGLGLTELSLLLMGMQRVQAASNAACRVGTLPAENATLQRQAMETAAKAALGSVDLIAGCEMQAQVGPYAGDPVIVEVTVPMTAAAPDLLRMIGFSLRGRELTAHTRMCKQ